MSRRSWTSLALLSIMIPVGLLATFRLTGVLEEPPTPEIITTETVKWSMQRPAETIFEIGETIENSYADNVTQITFKFIVYSYKEASGVFYYNDVLEFILNATADLSQGYIHSVAVKFSPTDVHAMLILGKNPCFYRLSNLRMSVFRTMGTSEQEAYIEASAVDRPQFCSLKTVYDSWVFTDENNANHRITITFEVTYFNGTAWKKVGIPIELRVNNDDNDDFATADEVCLKQTYSRLSLGGSDKQDFYTFNIDERHIRRTLRVTMTPPFDADFDLYLYGPDYESEGGSTNKENGMQENIYFNATSIGNWYVEARNYSNNDCGFYALSIDVIPDVNGDQLVDIVDIVIVALAFGATPEDAHWNPLADIIEPWDLVDIVDIVEVAIHFGESYEGGGLESRTGSLMTSPLNEERQRSPSILIHSQRIKVKVSR